MAAGRLAPKLHAGLVFNEATAADPGKADGTLKTLEHDIFRFIVKMRTKFDWTENRKLCKLETNGGRDECQCSSSTMSFSQEISIHPSTFLHRSVHIRVAGVLEPTPAPTRMCV